MSTNSPMLGKYLHLMILFLAPVLLQAQPTGWYSIKAFMPALDGSRVQLDVEGEKLHHGRVEKDMYSFTGTTALPKSAILSFTKSGRTIFLPFIIEPGTIKIRAQGARIVATGTPLNNQRLEVDRHIDSVLRLATHVSYDSVQELRRGFVRNYILSEPRSFIGLGLLYENFYRNEKASDTGYYHLFQALAPALQRSYLGRKIAEEVNRRYSTAVGRPAPLFSLPDQHGKINNLSFAGKYTLVNFWASWCLPCKKEHPALRKIFDKYQQAGFNIVSVSLDERKELWLNAVVKEKLTWVQVSDGNGWKSPVVRQYGVQLIPMNFLVDAQGMILGKNLNTEKLETLLSALLPL